MTYARTMQRQATQAQKDWLASIAQRCTHQITLQTNLTTYNKKANELEWMTTEAHGAMNYFIPRFNRAMTGNGWQRKAQYKLVIVTSLEGTRNMYDKNLTLHWHVMVGNIQVNKTTQYIHEAARRIWVGHAAAQDDVNCTELYDNMKFSNYIQKEVKKGNFDCVATQFMQA
jgi:hypothetical protein